MATTAVTLSADNCVFSDFTMLLVNELRKETRPDKEDVFYDSKRKRCLEQGACLVDILRQWIVGANTRRSKWTQRNPDWAAIPVHAVGIRNKPQLVNTCEKGTEEKYVHKGNEEKSWTLGCRVANQGIDGPENGQHAGDKKDQNVWRSKYVGLNVAINEPGLGPV